MLRIRYSPRETDIEGTAEDLRHLRSQLLELALEAKGQITVMVDANYDPKPFDTALKLVTISIGTGQTSVEVIDGLQLSVSASPENLRRLASFMVVPEEAQ